MVLWSLTWRSYILHREVTFFIMKLIVCLISFLQDLKRFLSIPQQQLPFKIFWSHDIHYMTKRMWTSVFFPQTVTKKLETHNCTSCLCMLYHYNFPSLELKILASRPRFRWDIPELEDNLGIKTLQNVTYLVHIFYYVF